MKVNKYIDLESKLATDKGSTRILSFTNFFLTYIYKGYFLNTISNQNKYSHIYSFLNDNYNSETKSISLDYQYLVSYSYDKTINFYFLRMLDKLNDIDKTEISNYDDFIKLFIANLYTKYIKKWDSLAQVLLLDYNPINNYDMNEEESSSIDETRTPNLKKDTTSKQSSNIKTTLSNKQDISGFNSDDYSPSTSSDQSQITTADANSNVTTDSVVEGGNEKKSRGDKRNLHRSGNIGVTTTQQMIESEIELRKHNLTTIIFDDLDNEFCLKTYD